MTAASLHTINRREGAPGAHRRRRPAALVALAGVAAFVAQVALAQVGTRLEKVELQPQSGDQLEVRLVLDGPAPQPVTFTVDNPARLSVDLPGAALALPSRRIDVNAGGVDTIVAGRGLGSAASCSTSTSCVLTRHGFPATTSMSRSGAVPLPVPCRWSAEALQSQLDSIKQRLS